MKWVIGGAVIACGVTGAMLAIMFLGFAAAVMICFAKLLPADGG